VADGLTERPLSTHEEEELYLLVHYPFEKCITCIPLDEILKQIDKGLVANCHMAAADPFRSLPISWVLAFIWDWYSAVSSPRAPQ
jgi:hypothetical protein